MGTPWETVQLTAFGRNKALYFDILEEGNYIYNLLTIHVADKYFE